MDKTNVDSVRAFVHAACRDYLAGIWSTVETSDIHVEKLWLVLFLLAIVCKYIALFVDG